MDANRIARQIAQFQANFNQQMHLPMQMSQQQQQMPVAEIEVSSEEEEDEDDEELRKLFCANIDERVTEELLYELFLQAGPLEKVHIPKDNNGRQRNFAFVTYVHKCSIPYAMRLYKGVELFRKTIAIKYMNSTNLPPMGKILLPEDPEAVERRRRHERTQNRDKHRGGYYDETEQISASLLRCGADDWMKGSAGRIVVKEPPHKHGGSYMRTQNRNAPYQRHDRDNRNRHNNYNSHRHSDQRHSGGRR